MSRDVIQPAGPLLQPIVMLEYLLYLQLNLVHDNVVTLADPRSLLLSTKQCHKGTRKLNVCLRFLPPQTGFPLNYKKEVP